MKFIREALKMVRPYWLDVSLVPTVVLVFMRAIGAPWTYCLVGGGCVAVLQAIWIGVSNVLERKREQRKLARY